MIASISVCAEQVFVPADAENGFLPDYASLSTETLNRTVAAYLLPIKSTGGHRVT